MVSSSGSSFELPCGRSSTDVVATLDLVDPGDGSQLAYAPVVQIDIPDVVTCGTSVALDATVLQLPSGIATSRARGGLWMEY